MPVSATRHRPALTGTTQWPQNTIPTGPDTQYSVVPNGPNTQRAAAGSLSGGNQQKIVVGRWLLTASEIYIFDEPTRGIDVGAKGEIHRLMRQLADDGKAVIMISSDLPEVIGMSDRVLVMRRGRIVADMTRADATEEAIVAHAAG